MFDPKTATEEQQLQFVKTELPKMRKEAEDAMRLIELAKKSPFASANSDFIERMELLWAGRRAEAETMNRLFALVEKHL